MREQIVSLYQFDELSAGAKEKVLREFADINVDYDWWQSVYIDAEDVGVKITSFDIDRGDIEIDFCESAEHTAHRIMGEHGDTCDTYKSAKNYLMERHGILTTAPKDKNIDQALTAVGNEFLCDIGEEYLAMLSKDYDYLTTEDAIAETIRANRYEFTEYGKQF